MFPLGSVLFPSLVLPLHLFEPRYRVLIRDVLAGDREFGVCLIERGAEVGGNDVRLDVGTVAHVEDATELPDGRWAVVAVGTRRIVVEEWLPDDPYPRARVREHPEPPLDGDEAESVSGLVAEATSLLRSVLAKATELGEPAPPATVALSDDPVLASHQISAFAPIPTLDRYELLAAPSAKDRISSVLAHLREVDEVLDLRLAGEGSADDGP